MAWDNNRYLHMREQCQNDINREYKTPADYMLVYKKMIMKDDYEAAKAITEVLAPLNYDTAMTHDHISKLNKKKK